MPILAPDPGSPPHPILLPPSLFKIVKYGPSPSLSLFVGFSAIFLLGSFVNDSKSVKVPLAQRRESEVDRGEILDRFDPATYDEGQPIDEEKFWSSIQIPKALYLILTAATFGLQLSPCITEAVCLDNIVDVTAAAYIMGLATVHLLTQDRRYHASLASHLAVLSVTMTITLILRVLLPYFVEHEPAVEAMTPLLSSKAFQATTTTTFRLISLATSLAGMFLVSLIPNGPELQVDLKLFYTSSVVAAIEKSAPEQTDGGNVTRELSVSALGKIFSSYAWSIIKRTAATDQVDVQDLPMIPVTLRSLSVMRRSKWDMTPVHKDSPKGSSWKLLKQLWGNLTTEIAITTFLWIAGTLIYYIPHYCLQRLIESMQGDRSHTQGLIFGVLLVVTRLGRNMFLVVMWRYSVVNLENTLTILLQGRLFQKLLTRRAFLHDPSEEKAKEDAGKKKEKNARTKAEILTLITSDVARTRDLIYSILSMITTPAELAVGLLYIFALLGPSALVGLTALVVIGPVSFFITKIQYRIFDKRLKAKDAKMAVMGEMVQSLSNVKTFAFEDVMEKRVMDAREEEFRLWTRGTQVGWAAGFFYSLAPVAIIITSFWHFAVVRGEVLTPGIAFTTIVVFSELRYSLLELPRLLTQILEELLACRRIQSFLSEPDVQETHTPYDFIKELCVSNATITWSPPSKWELSASAIESLASETFVLKDIDAIFPRGQLSLITGRIGSGKSLLLHALLGEAEVLAGSINFPTPVPLFGSEIPSHVSEIPPAEWMTDSIAFVPQTAFLKSSSIRENICGHLPMVEERYKAVIAATGLLPDLELLEDSDLTQIGERGKVLSGGQKARVSLARAVYSRARTLLLDDTLSAVDTHTAAHIVKHVFGGPLMSGRTVIIVSHAVELLRPLASYALVLHAGKQLYAGDPGAMPQVATPGDEKSEEASAAASDDETRTLVGKTSPKPAVAQVPAVATEKQEIEDAEKFELKVTIPRTPRQLVLEEKRGQGTIARDYWAFFLRMSGGGLAWIPFAIEIVLLVASPVVERMVLSTWTGTSEGSAPHATSTYLMWYFAASLGTVIFGIIDNIARFYLGIGSTRRVHHKMLHSVLHAKLRFFSQTTAGRIIARFTTDVDTIIDLTIAVCGVVYQILSIVVALVSISLAGKYWFSVGALLLLYVVWRTSFVHRAAARDVTRLMSVTRGPINTAFGETIAGITVIRAFGLEGCELKELAGALNVMNVARYWSTIFNYWLWSALKLLDTAIIAMTVALVLTSPNMSAATAGFLLAFANGISNHVDLILNHLRRLETNGVCLERTKEYCELPDEDPRRNADADSYAALDPTLNPPAAWPTTGRIEFKNLVVRYAPELQDVLHGISFAIEGGTRVGVVGSTGSGKSTLAKTLFRFLEVRDGGIEIDGIDISRLALADLRTRISIVPQDPVILSGTIRSALDVLGEFSDEELYAVLRQVHLIPPGDLPSETSSGGSGSASAAVYNPFRSLDTEVQEGGSNFSAGEKQLLVLARTILKSQKVLLMDEATSSMDHESDAHITETIRTGFPEATMLIIAHRLKTIMDCDKVLVLEKGRVAEYDAPWTLLQNESGRFYELCRASGEEEFRALRRMAEEAAGVVKNRM